MKIPSGIQALLFDVDKTLTNTQRVITPRTKRALNKLVEKGYHLGICTGRGYARVWEEILPLFPPDSLHIVSAGAQVVTTDGQIRWERLLPPQTVRELIDLAQKYQAEFVFDSGKETFGSSRFVAEWGLKPVPDQQPLSVPDFVLYEINQAIRAEVLARTDIHAREMTSTALGIPLLEITAQEVNKSRGVIEWARLQGVSPAEIAGFGDSENDLEFLDTVGWAVAMGNAVPEVKEKAQVVIGHTDEEGLAKYLEEYFL